MSGRLVGDAELETALEDARERGLRVVLATGCFDLLHPGHLSYLREARALGDLLVVGVNTDESVARVKGPGRPLVADADRAEVVAALEPVDLAVLFPEVRAEALLRRVRPALFVKGGDFDPGNLPEAQTAAELGTEVVMIPYLAGYSTEALLTAIRDGSER